MMCIMEAHVNEVLHSSASAIQPRAVISVLTLTCSSCKAVSDSYEAFLDIPLDIKAASSVTAALEGFVKPEQLDGENCFKCSKCDKMVAASKRFTIHCVPKVLTLCLKRFGDFSGRKISKVVEYPEYLDLRPYTSQTAGEPLLYALYAVLVHHGGSCCAGHYFCYTKASNGLWYKMNDTSVDGCGTDTVLRQQAYLLFYVRCSDLRTGEGASSSPAPSYARSFLSQGGANSKQVSSVGPQGLPRALRLDIASYMCRRQPDCPVPCQPSDRVLHTMGEGNNEEERRFSPSSRCQRNSARERARSRSPHGGKDLHSWFVENTDYEHSAGRRRRRTGAPSHQRAPRDGIAPRPSNASSQLAPAPTEQSLPGQREQSRSPWPGNDLRCWFVDTRNYDHSAGRRRRTSHPSCDRTARDDAAAGPSSTSSQSAPARRAAQEQTLPRQRERSRSPLWGSDCRSWSVVATDYDLSAGRRRRTTHPSCDRAARDDAAAGASNASSQSAPARRAAQEQTLPRQRERSRSPLWGSDCRSWSVVATDYDLSAGRRRRTTHPSCDRAARDDAAAGASNASSQSAPARRAAEEQRAPVLRERSRSPLWGSDCRSWFVVATDYDLSAGRRRRVSAPKRCRTDKHSGGIGVDRGRFAASGQEELRETFKRLGELCQLACLPTGPSRRSLNPCSAFGIALQKQHSFGTNSQKSQSQN
ncbi:hypothetical protein QYF61_005476 [Mycteria americana]|uniref:USP domain-containing protein n=1 Tax=Mycteria americana TaxID=33587 RepID=A0AAN7RGS1_MYCAM|nr:hypothetical protein QYF61_005476 [Mycteria americana]